MAYATALLRDPAATYRHVDAVGRTATADAAGLVQVLYEECISALRAAAWAAQHGKLGTKSERVTRATAILFALEAGLDFDRGGDVSASLARVYGGVRRQVVSASLGTDAAPFHAAAATLDDIASAWRTARAA